MATAKLSDSATDCREQWEIDFERDARESHHERMGRSRPRAERAKLIRRAAAAIPPINR